MTMAFLNPWGTCIAQKKLCLRILCVHENFFKSLGRSETEFLQCMSTCQKRNVRYEEQANSFFLMCDQGISFFERHKKQSSFSLETPIVLPGILRDKIVSLSIHGKRMTKVDTNVCHAKEAATF